MSLTGKQSLTTANPITNDGFWFDMSVADLLSKYRVSDEVPDKSIETALVLAMVRVNIKLEQAKAIIVGLGFIDINAYITDSPRPIAGGELLQTHYEHAVYAHAKSYLIPLVKSTDRRDNKGESMEDATQLEDYWLHESQKSIAFLHNLFVPESPIVATANVHVGLI